MPRADEPRIVVRLSRTDNAVIEAAANSANVAVGALVRECAVRYAATVARDVLAGNVTMRQQRVERAEAAAPVVRAVSLVPTEAEMVRQERQDRVNAQTLRARAGRKPPARPSR